VGAQQHSRLRTPLYRLYEIVSQSVLGRPLDKGFEFQFRPLWQLSDTDKASITAQVGQTVNGLEQSGTISQANALKELQRLSKITGAFSGITQDDIDAAEAEPPEPTLPEPPPFNGESDVTEEAKEADDTDNAGP
jgi:hypothetical protein